MRYLTAALTTVATSLWLGGLITLALMVMAVFLASGLDRPTAGQAAAAMFVWYGKAQLLIGAIALIAAFLGYLQQRNQISIALFTLLAIAAVGAIGFNALFIPKLEALRQSGQSLSPEFKTLHKQSEMLMQAVIAIVFAATLILPAFCRALLTPQPKPESPSA